MDIKDKLIGSGETEFPDDFVENKKEIDKAEDMEIEDFIKKKKVQKAEKEKKNEVKEEPQKAIEPLHDKIPTATKEQQPEIPEIKDEKLSNFAKVITIYLKENEIDGTKKKVFDAVTSDYDVALQAGIRITKENVQEVLSVLKYFSDNGYLVVISGERVEPLFHEPTK